MIKKLLVIFALSGGMALSACNTVRGAGEDIQSAANCTENTINGGNC